MTSWLRERLPYVALATGTMGAGLMIHLRGAALAPDARDLLGDVLWAAMIVWWTGAMAPRASLFGRATVALGICFAVELSQLIRTPLLEALRSRTLGHLVLGSDFHSRDLVAYTLGVLAATLLEQMAVRAR